MGTCRPSRSCTVPQNRARRPAKRTTATRVHYRCVGARAPRGDRACRRTIPRPGALRDRPRDGDTSVSPGITIGPGAVHLRTTQRGWAHPGTAGESGFPVGTFRAAPGPGDGQGSARRRYRQGIPARPPHQGTGAPPNRREGDPPGRAAARHGACRPGGDAVRRGKPDLHRAGRSPGARHRTARRVAAGKGREPRRRERCRGGAGSVQEKGVPMPVNGRGGGIFDRNHYRYRKDISIYNSQGVGSFRGLVLMRPGPGRRRARGPLS